MTGAARAGRTGSTDEIFIRAPQRAIARAILDLSDDSSWWPRARVRGGYGWLEVDAPTRRGRIRFKAIVGPVREWEGFGWTLEEGDLLGRAEFWFEAFKDGTIVHHYLDVERGARGRRRLSARLERHRLAMRRGLNGLKDRLEAGATSRR